VQLKQKLKDFIHWYGRGFDDAEAPLVVEQQQSGSCFNPRGL
jgi:hypothetical protein